RRPWSSPPFEGCPSRTATGTGTTSVTFHCWRPWGTLMSSTVTRTFGCTRSHTDGPCWRFVRHHVRLVPHRPCTLLSGTGTSAAVVAHSRNGPREPISAPPRNPLGGPHQREVDDEVKTWIQHRSPVHTYGIGAGLPADPGPGRHGCLAELDHVPQCRRQRDQHRPHRAGPDDGGAHRRPGSRCRTRWPGASRRSCCSCPLRSNRLPGTQRRALMD